MVGVIKRIWIPIVMVFVVGLGTVTIARLHRIFAANRSVSEASNADAIISFNPKHLIYQVFGPAGTTATIDYLDAKAEPHEVDGVTIPWTLEIETTLSSVVANVVAQGDSQILGCRIYVNGVVRDELTVSSHNAETSCLVKSA
jgi:hypothetical protein